MGFNGGVLKGRVNRSGAVRKIRAWTMAERLRGGGLFATNDIEGEDFGDYGGSMQN